MLSSAFPLLTKAEALEMSLIALGSRDGRCDQDSNKPFSLLCLIPKSPLNEHSLFLQVDMEMTRQLSGHWLQDLGF